MKLIIQPEAGIAPVVQAISKREDVDRHLHLPLRSRRDREGARRRGAARRRRSGAHRPHQPRRRNALRKLEQRLLAAGATVSRTADDLLRYHAQVHDRRRRCCTCFGFNFTKLDIDKSRSFAIATKDRRAVQEALKLFAADVDAAAVLARHVASGRQPGERRASALAAVHQRARNAAAHLRRRRSRTRRWSSCSTSGQREGVRRSA